MYLYAYIQIITATKINFQLQIITIIILIMNGKSLTLGSWDGLIGDSFIPTSYLLAIVSTQCEIIPMVPMIYIL